jgi:uncharacterized membrane protein YdjX (TVP38/TMEM64 family)
MDSLEDQSNTHRELKSPVRAQYIAPLLKFLILLSLVGLGFALVHFTEFGHYLKPGNIRKAILSFGLWAPGIYLLLFGIGPVFLWPEAILAMAGGLAFGPMWGTVLTTIGATFGGTLAFLVARYLGRDFIKRFFRGRLRTLDEKSAEHGFKIIFFLRLIPLVPFNALDYAAGLSKIKLRDYVLGTFLGIMPGAFAYVNLGSRLENIYSWAFVLAVTFLALLVTIPMLYQRWKTGKPIGKLVVLMLFVLGVILFFYFDLGRYLTLTELKAHRETLLNDTEAHYGLAVAIFILVYCLQTAFSLPGATILTLGGGFVFGVFLGTLYVNLGATAGATLAFLASRYLFRELVEKRFGERIRPIQEGFAKNAFHYLLTLRLIPLFPFFLVNLVSGLTRIRTITYVLTTSVGIIPGSFVYCNAGRQLGSIDSLGEIASPRVLGAFTLLGLFALLPVLYKRFRKPAVINPRF